MYNNEENNKLNGNLTSGENVQNGVAQDGTPGENIGQTAGYNQNTGANQDVSYNQNTGINQNVGYNQSAEVNRNAGYNQNTGTSQNAGDYQSTGGNRNVSYNQSMGANQNTGYNQGKGADQNVNYNRNAGYYQNTQPDRNAAYAQDAGYAQMNDAGMSSGKKAKKQKKQTGKSDFPKKLTRCAAYALAFGLVAGTAFQGSSYAMKNLFGDKESSESVSTEVASSAENNGDALPATNVTSDVVTDISSVDVSKIVENVMPSVVAITNMTEIQYPSFFGYSESGQNESAGSGFIVGEDDTHLYIATNNHVVKGADSLTVQFHDETTASAEVQGTDVTNDLAVVKVKKADMEKGALENVKVAAFGDSKSLAVGEAAIAIGNALGYGQSVTTGVVSALDRLVSVQDETTGQTISSRLIQTDAAINPGNSGGALLNVKGEVIGINSSKYSDTSVEGMGFAIPVATAKPIIDELIATGKSTSAQGAYLGISGVDVTEKESVAYNFPIGAYITQVMEDSAAAKAGLAQGDIITKVDKTEVASFTELKTVLSGHRAGDEVTLTYERRGENGEYEEHTVKVTLGEYPKEDTEDESQKNSDEKRPQQDEDRQEEYEYGDDWNVFPYDFFEEFGW